MKIKFAFGFALLILVIVAILFGAPYLLNIIKGNQALSPPNYIQRFGNYFKINLPDYSYSQSSGQQPAARQPEQTLEVDNVKISSVYRYGSGQINLRAGAGGADITGWKIKSENKGETIIGRGAAIPQFGGLSDIMLSSGGSAEINVGLSPLGGSFRVNDCLGWLGNIYNVGSSLNSCSDFKLSDIPGLDSRCQELILNTSSCRVPSDDILNQHSSQCRKWVEQNMNYNACVLKNRNDSDFYKEWQIYTGNANPIYDPLHDRIELINRSGVLIDRYEY